MPDKCLTCRNLESDTVLAVKKHRHAKDVYTSRAKGTPFETPPLRVEKPDALRLSPGLSRDNKLPWLRPGGLALGGPSVEIWIFRKVGLGKFHRGTSRNLSPFAIGR